MAPITRICSLITLAAVLVPAAAFAKRENDTSSAVRSYALARTALYQGDDEAALARYARVIDLQAGDAQIYGRVMREAVRQGDMKLAIRAVYQMGLPAQLPPDALLLLLSDRIKRNDLRGAAPLIDALEANENFRFMGPLMRSWSAVPQRGTASIQILDQISRRSTAAYYVPEIKAYQLMAAGRQGEGLTLARSLALGSNSTPALRLSTASTLLQAGRREEALSLVGAAGDELSGARVLIEKGGNGLPPVIKTPAQGMAQLYTRLAGDLITQKAPGFALMFARYARYLDAANPFVALTEARALAAAQRGDHADAALSALAANPIVGGEARKERIGILESLDRFEDALGLAKDLAAAQSTQTEAQVRLADMQARAGHYKDAAASYDRAIGMAATSGGAEAWLLHYSRGSALERAGQWKDARAALEMAVQIAPNQPGPLNHLGYAMLERREEMPRALELVKRAHDLNPTSLEILDSYGWGLYLNGKYDEAIEVLERAVRGDPTEATLGEHLGDVYWAAGRKIDARYAWQAAHVVSEGDLKKRLAAKMDFGLIPKTAKP